MCEVDVLDSPQTSAVSLQSSVSSESDSHSTPCCVVNLMSNRNPCSDSGCSSDYPSSHHVTSQCTDQCVVITCNDSTHLQNSCNGYDGACNNGSDCHDCGGFEEFLQCCTDYHSYMSDPKAMNYQDWDPSLEQLLCACDQQQHSNQSHHHLHLHAQHANLSANFSLSPVDHSFPIPQPLPNVQNPAPISPISPTDSGYDFSSTLAPSIPSHLAEQAHTNNSVEQTLPISCMWGSCHARFSTSEELIAHVNSDHLKTSQTGASSPLSHSHPHEKQCNDKHTSKFSCLWRDCHEFFPDLMPDAPSMDRPHAPYDNLAIHILSEHLGYPGPHLPPLPRFPQDYPKDYPTPPSEHSFPQNDSATFLSEGEAASPFGTPPPAYLDSCPQLQAPFDNLSVNSKGKDGEQHVCRWQDCNQSFATSDELTAHLSTQHVGSGKAHYECFWHDCTRNGQKGFTSKQKICRHLQSHTGHRPFQCKLCNQNFSEAATLQQHMRRHTQEKPYVCDFPGCGKSFAITGALTIHKRTHNGHKPFKCTFCERAFAESSNLSKHLRTHTGARPYPCSEPGCNKSFARPDQLNRHLNVHRKKEAATAAS